MVSVARMIRTATERQVGRLMLWTATVFNARSRLSGKMGATQDVSACYGVQKGQNKRQRNGATVHEAKETTPSIRHSIQLGRFCQDEFILAKGSFFGGNLSAILTIP